MTKNISLISTMLLLILKSNAQQLYFPPVLGNTWETMTPAQLGWCEDSIPPMLDYLDASNSKGFLVLKDGKIVIEHYFDTFTQDSLWYWASAGKSMTSFLVGLAQEQGLLDINDASSDYMGQGWTSLTAEQEAAITVRNQLTMTTGLSDLTGDADCTDPECLVYLADPGDRWAYHNAPYTLLDSVLQSATGTSLNLFLLNNLSTTTGIFGGYFPSGYNNVLFSKPRVFARFGLLMLNQGNWNGTQIMNDMNYFNAMTHSSQDLNPAYGYLWWLNGSANYMLPGSQISFPGPLAPDAPSDMYSAMGKNGQIINIVPSQNLIMVRIGEAPTNEIFFVPNVYNNTLWQYLNNVMNCANRVSETNTTSDVRIYPNPTTSYLQLNKYSPETTVSIFDCIGNLMMKTRASAQLDVSSLSPGSYQLVVTDRTLVRCHHFIKD